MNEVGFCPVVGGVLSSGVLSCGVLSVWGFVLWGFVRTPLRITLLFKFTLYQYLIIINH